MKVSKETIKKLEDLGYRIWGDRGLYESFLEDENDYENATILVVAWTREDGGDEIKRFRTPKLKEVTIEWVMNKLNQESSYKNLYWYLRKHFCGCEIDIYAASYGIGVSTLCGHKIKAEKVAEKLKELGLKYRNEFSEAGWVYKFIIGKDKHNLAILQAIN